MAQYNYLEAIKNDIIKYALPNYDLTQDINDLGEQLNEDLWIDDSITGNASGSYTFNSALAKEYVLDNLPLAMECYKEFDSLGMFVEALGRENWEIIDVSIRCYLLGQAIGEALEEVLNKI